MDDEEGFSYDSWMQMLTYAIDNTLKEAKVDLDYGDNRYLRNKELNFVSSEWERIKFFEQHLPTVDDFEKMASHFVDQLPLFTHGQRREFRLALAHEENVKEWLGTTKFSEQDRQYILDRERYLAEHFFEDDDKYQLYEDSVDFNDYTQIRLRQIFARFLNDYPGFY